MSRKLPLIFLIALSLAMPGIASGASSTKFTPGSAGIGDPYFPLDGNGGYDVKHYGLKMTYDPETDFLTGKATIQVRATQNLSSFNLDFIGLNLRSLLVNGVPAATTRDGQELTVTPVKGIRKNSRFTVVARYDGVPETLEEFGLSGFIHTEDGAIVIGEPHVAASWFPANDHPRDRASFTISITVPDGVEAISNGVLLGKRDRGAWDTWRWYAQEPMAPYLAMMAIGQFEVRSYVADGVKYWDALDSALMVEEPPAKPVTGELLLYSQVGEPAYKRLTRTIDVPAGGANLSFRVDRDTEPGWDFVFVESRAAGGTDWTTLPDANGHTDQDVGACPGFLEFNPFLEHYLTPVLVDGGDPTSPDDDFFSCDPTGSTGAWNAASGSSDGWESWSINLPNEGATTIHLEVSITYASDGAVQFSGVALDDIVVSTGQGTTSFEDDGDQLDGWIAPIEGPPGSADNPNTWIPATETVAVPPVGASALVSFDRQPEIIAWEEDLFGRYPFSAAGAVLDDAGVGFALENQTRPTYSPPSSAARRATTRSSSTSSPTSGSGTACSSTRGSTSGLTRASPPTRSGCGARSRGSRRRPRSSGSSPRSRPMTRSGRSRSVTLVRS